MEPVFRSCRMEALGAEEKKGGRLWRPSCEPECMKTDAEIIYTNVFIYKLL